MCEHHARGKPEEGVGSPENGVTVVSHHVGSEPQSCAEQPEFLTAEPALAHPTPLLTSNPTKRSTDRPHLGGRGLQKLEASAGGAAGGWAGPCGRGRSPWTRLGSPQWSHLWRWAGAELQGGCHSGPTPLLPDLTSLFLPSASTWKMGSRAAEAPWTLNLAASSSPLASKASGASPSCTAPTVTMSLHRRLCPGTPRWPVICEAPSSF